MNLLDLLKDCSIRLIYLGNQRFGVLTWRSRLPKKVASKSPSFNIVEEYMLDEDIDSTKQVINVTFIERFVHFFRLMFQEPMSLFSVACLTNSSSRTSLKLTKTGLVITSLRPVNFP